MDHIPAERAARLAPLALAALVALAAPSPAAAQTESPCGGFEQVREGDTLAEIARRCGVSIPSLLAANPAVRGNPDLTTGASVAIPAPGTPEPTPQEACGGFYTVRAGDTLEGVAALCGLSVAALSAANGPLPTPLGLAAGSEIRIPPVPRRFAQDTSGAVWTAAGAAGEAAAQADTAGDTTREAAADAEAEAPRELVRRSGVLRAGERCMVLELADGQRVGLAGLTDRISTFEPGDRVVVVGPEVEESSCDTDETMEARIIWPDDA